MAKPTDGPWAYESTNAGHFWVLPAEGARLVIAEVYDEADARLIAKARHLPEVVEALELMLTYWAAVPENEIGVAGRRTMSKARATLALVQDEDHG